MFPKSLNRLFSILPTIPHFIPKRRLTTIRIIGKNFQNNHHNFQQNSSKINQKFAQKNYQTKKFSTQASQPPQGIVNDTPKAVQSASSGAKAASKSNPTNTQIIENVENIENIENIEKSVPKIHNMGKNTSNLVSTPISTTPLDQSITNGFNNDLKNGLKTAKPPKKSRFFRKFLTLSFLSSIMLLTYEGSKSPGFKRSWKFWSQAFPIYLHYQVVMTVLDFRQWLTNVLIRYDKDFYGPQLAELGLDEFGRDIFGEEKSDKNGEKNEKNDEILKILEENNENVKKPAEIRSNTLTSWRDKKAEADLDYLHKINDLVVKEKQVGYAQSDENDQNNSQNNNKTDFSRVIEIKDTINENKLDRFFANFNQAVEQLRNSPEMDVLQARLNEITQKELDLKLLDQLPLLAQDTIAFHTHLPSPNELIYFCKKQLHLLGQILADLNPLPDNTKVQIRKRFDVFKQSIDKYIISNAVIAVSPHLRKYTLPLHSEAKKIHRDSVFEPLNIHYATDLHRIIYELRGYFLKIGQLGALRGDFLPKPWIHELKKFQNECPHVELIELVPTIEAEIGKISDNFEYIDPTPLGSAAIGQVHYARLKGGQEVVIKLQYPDVEWTFREDIKTVRAFCTLAQPEQLPQLDELEKAFLSEFDFAREAVQLHFAAQDMIVAKNLNQNNHNQIDDFSNYIQIPKPIPHLCSKNCLVMEYLPGSRLTTHLERSVEKMAKDQGITTDEFIERYGKTPPPTTEEIKNYKKMANLYDNFSNSAKVLYNYTLGWFTEPYEYTKTTVPTDIRRIVKYVYQAHGQQVFYGTCVNSDPHPGNITFCESDNDLGGNIGLLDFGQVKTVSLWYRAILAHLMIALQEEDWDKVAHLGFFSGFRSEHNYRGPCVEQIVLGFDYDNDESRRGMNVEAYFKYISALDKPLQIQEKLALVGQVTFFLRALPQYLNFQARASDYWAPMGKEFLQQHPVLDEIIRTGLDEFTQLYNTQLHLAQRRAREDLGSDDEYFVDLSEGFVIQDWCEAMGRKYNDEYYKKMFVDPFPVSLLDYQEFDEGEKQSAKLRGEKLLQFTHRSNLGDFLPVKGEDDVEINYGAKKYDFWEKKPNFVDSMVRNYISPHEKVRMGSQIGLGMTKSGHIDRGV